jgi:hypothetical protein
MTISEIKELLPKIDSKKLDEMKLISPRKIMNNYSDAIIEKYPGFFKSIIYESIKIIDNNDEQFSYSFYLIALIARGYNHLLFDVTPKRIDSQYPVNIKFYNDFLPKEIEVLNETEFNEILVNFFKSGCFSNLINNLSEKVKEYDNNRN